MARDDDEDDIPRKRSRARDDDEDEPRVRKERRYDDDEDEEDSRDRKKRRYDDDDRPSRGRSKGGKQGNGGLLVVGIIGGVVVLFLVLGAVAFVIGKSRRDSTTSTASSSSTSSETYDFGGTWPDSGFQGGPNSVILHILGLQGSGTVDVINERLDDIVPPGGGSRSSRWTNSRLSIHISPIRNPEEFAKRINFGKVVSVQGNVISIVCDKLELPPTEPVARAIRDIKTNKLNRQKSGCGALVAALPDNRRADVLQLLEPLTDAPDADLRFAATHAYCAWATTDNVPTLVKIISGDSYQPGMKFVMETLARLKDERGLAPISKWLGKGGSGRFDSVAALTAYGSVAEDQMIKLLKLADVDIRTGACEILERIGTQKCFPALEQASKDSNFFVQAGAKQALESLKKRLGRP